MLLPGVVLVSSYSYGPMFGIIMSLSTILFPPRASSGSEWVGLDNFRYVLDMPDTFTVLWNTMYISIMKIVVGLVFPI